MIGGYGQTGTAALVAGLLLLVAPVAAQPPAPEPPEAAVPALPPGEPPTAARVQFTGNRRVAVEAMAGVLRTRPGTPVTQARLRADVRSLWRLGAFQDVRVEVRPAAPDPGVEVIFIVEEKPAVARIEITGNRAVDTDRLERALELRPGELVDAARARRNADRIREVYLERGHFASEVHYTLRPAPDHTVVVSFRVREGPRATVAGVRFVGNRSISDAELRDVVLTRAAGLLEPLTGAGRFREEVVERDVLLLQAHYLDRGYVHARVERPRVTLSADRRRVYVTFVIREGQVYRVGSVDVEGELIEPREALLERLRVEPGEVFSRSRVGRDVETLARLYRDRGYAYANVNPQTTFRDDERLVDLTYELEHGPPVTIERIDVRGNRRTRDKVIRRELRILEGERYSESQLELSRRRVAALGYFERVDMSTRRGSADDRMEVAFEVAERNTGSFQFGAGFSSAENLLVQAQVSESNLFGRGQTLALHASLSSFRRLFVLQFQEPYFLDTSWTFGFSAYDQVRVYSAFLRTSTGGTLTWGYVLSDALRAFLTHTVEQVALDTRRRGLLAVGPVSPVPRGALANLLRAGFTSSPQVQLIYDTRDNRLFPTRGVFSTVAFEVADRYTGSENVFTRAEAAARYFRPLFGPFVLRLRLQGGIITSRDPRGVPLFERYFGGGIFDVRGFLPRSLAPRIRTLEGVRPDLGLITFPIGGNLHLVSNNEVEFAIFERFGLRGVVFVDAGNTFNLERQYCLLRPPQADAAIDPCNVLLPLASLRYSWGFGLRWFSPIGPLRFEWGIPFRTRPGEEPVVFEFTIGNAF